MIGNSKIYALAVCLSLLLASPVFCKTHLLQPEDNDPVRSDPVRSDPVRKELEAYAKNKVIPDKMREVILTALSFYPELESTKIAFLFKDNIKKSVMQAQPKISTFFGRKSEREYVVKISRYLKLKHERVDITTLPFEVLVGWIGHELGHIMDYKDRNTFSMIGFGTSYFFSKKFVVSAERRADLFALEHGLGNDIMETKHFVLNNADIPDTYKNRIKRLYMSPEDFMMLLGEAAP